MSFFDQNNPEHQQLAHAYRNGSYAQLPPNQVMSHYQSFLQSAPEDEINRVHQEYFNQMPQTERSGLFSGLLGALQGQPNFNQNQAGLSTTNPNNASALDLGNLFNMARSSGILGSLIGGGQQQQQQQGSGYQQGGGLQGLQGLMNNPLAQSAISGLISYGASRAFGGMFGGGQQQQQQSQQQQGYNAPQQSNLNPPSNGQAW